MLCILENKSPLKEELNLRDQGAGTNEDFLQDITVVKKKMTIIFHPEVTQDKYFWKTNRCSTLLWVEEHLS